MPSAPPTPYYKSWAVPVEDTVTDARGCLRYRAAPSPCVVTQISTPIPRLCPFSEFLQQRASWLVLSLSYQDSGLSPANAQIPQQPLQSRLTLSSASHVQTSAGNDLRDQHFFSHSLNRRCKTLRCICVQGSSCPLFFGVGIHSIQFGEELFSRREELYAFL